MSGPTLSVKGMPHGAEVISPFDGQTLRVVDPIRMDSEDDICSICPYTDKEECAKTDCTGRFITTSETFALKVLIGEIDAP